MRYAQALIPSAYQRVDPVQFSMTDAAYQLTDATSWTFTSKLIGAEDGRTAVWLGLVTTAYAADYADDVATATIQGQACTQMSTWAAHVRTPRISTTFLRCNAPLVGTSADISISIPTWGTHASYAMRMACYIFRQSGRLGSLLSTATGYTYTPGAAKTSDIPLTIPDKSGALVLGAQQGDVGPNFTSADSPVAATAIYNGYVHESGQTDYIRANGASRHDDIGGSVNVQLFGRSLKSLGYHRWHGLVIG